MGIGPLIAAVGAAFVKAGRALLNHLKRNKTIYAAGGLGALPQLEGMP